MLVELGVKNLGVIAEARIPLQGGLVALTGETGAGKTMIVEALELLSGGRADPSRVRAGCDEAVVEGLFATGDEEHVLRRVVPAAGRSRSYVDGQLATAANLTELAAELIEIHGQHAQQALLRPSVQRDALDRYAGIDRTRLRELRDRVRDLEAELERTGGDERARQREMDLLRHQIDEIEALAPVPGEDEELEAEESLLADAVAHREAAAASLELLTGEGAAADLLAAAAGQLDGRAPLEPVAGRLAALSIELGDCASELRALAETIEPDEPRLEQVRARRNDLSTLRRKYGDTIEQVLEFAAESRARLAQLASLDQRRAELGALIEAARADLAAECRKVGDARRAAAPRLAAAIRELLAQLAMAAAEVEVAVEDTAALPGAGEDVEIRLASNPGAPPGPLQRVASGGELSRVMMALRLVLSGGPPTMVFDEVDAGIGGEAAVAVGRSLAELGAERQVLVVTHLPQVAAFADHQLRVTKQVDGTVTVTTVEPLDESDRVVELSRMLSGSPGSSTAREHASELLEAAARARGR
ncbi:MAG TPA: DNA repair protein RecN [Microthrixaceae bacterium]|nr:DNA repair protein RecN [Microthrixaceae bacterium]